MLEHRLRTVLANDGSARWHRFKPSSSRPKRLRPSGSRQCPRIKADEGASSSCQASNANRMGKAAERLIAVFCIRTTRGALNVSTALVDDEGIDLVFHRRGSTATLAVPSGEFDYLCWSDHRTGRSTSAARPQPSRGWRAAAVRLCLPAEIARSCRRVRDPTVKALPLHRRVHTSWARMPARAHAARMW